MTPIALSRCDVRWCHVAPGREPAEWSRRMRPESSLLTEAAREWTAEEIRWLGEDGVKMSGMPDVGAHHGAEGITPITAFVQQLPGLTCEDCAELTAAHRLRCGTARRR